MGRAEAQIYTTTIFDRDGNILHATTLPPKAWGDPINERTVQNVFSHIGATGVRSLGSPDALRSALYRTAQGRTLPVAPKPRRRGSRRLPHSTYAFAQSLFPVGAPPHDSEEPADRDRLPSGALFQKPLELYVPIERSPMEGLGWSAVFAHGANVYAATVLGNPFVFVITLGCLRGRRSRRQVRRQSGVRAVGEGSRSGPGLRGFKKSGTWQLFVPEDGDGAGPQRASSGAMRA